MDLGSLPAVRDVAGVQQLGAAQRRRSFDAAKVGEHSGSQI
jgi:hypothetical protein